MNGWKLFLIYGNQKDKKIKMLYKCPKCWELSVHRKLYPHRTDPNIVCRVEYCINHCGYLLDLPSLLKIEDGYRVISQERSIKCNE